MGFLLAVVGAGGLAGAVENGSSPTGSVILMVIGILVFIFEYVFWSNHGKEW